MIMLFLPNTIGIWFTPTSELLNAIICGLKQGDPYDSFDEEWDQVVYKKKINDKIQVTICIHIKNV